MSDKLMDKLFNETNSFIQQQNLVKYSFLKKRELEFQLIFNFELVEYVRPVLGFDVEAFIHDFVPDNRLSDLPLIDIIRNKYGERASDLFMELIS